MQEDYCRFVDFKNDYFVLTSVAPNGTFQSLKEIPNLSIEVIDHNHRRGRIYYSVNLAEGAKVTSDMFAVDLINATYGALLETLKSHGFVVNDAYGPRGAVFKTSLKGRVFGLMRSLLGTPERRNRLASNDNNIHATFYVRQDLLVRVSDVMARLITDGFDAGCARGRAVINGKAWAFHLESEAGCNTDTLTGRQETQKLIEEAFIKCWPPYEDKIEFKFYLIEENEEPTAILFDKYRFGMPDPAYVSIDASHSAEVK